MSSLFKAWRPVFHRPATDELSIRGYFPIGSEQAVGAPEPDPKCYFEFVPGGDLAESLMSTVAGVHGRLLSVLREQTAVIARRVASMRAEHFAMLLDRAPPPVLRITYYPRDKSREIANYPHSDIDLVTLLPRATAPGLQVASDGGWHEIQIDEESVIVLAGEMLELLGGPTAEIHRVVGVDERLCVSFFVNASPDERLPDGRVAGVVLEERLRMVRGAREPS